MSRRERSVELELDQDAVRAEHAADTNVRAHWLYLLGVLAGAGGLMLSLMVVLDALA